MTDQRKGDAAAYVGRTDRRERLVWVEREDGSEVLHPGGDEFIAGFRWGSRGIAVRELARAILLDATGSPVLAELRCRAFAGEVLVGLPEDGFRLEGEEVRRWVEREASVLAVA
jgi:hypothetical protein